MSHSLDLQAESGENARPRASVAIAFVRGMLAPAMGRGQDPTPWLTAVGLAPACLEDEKARIPLDRYAALYNEVVAALDDEAFGLFAAPLRAGTLEFLCRAAITAPTLAQALDRCCRFLRLVLPELEVRVIHRQGTALLEIREATPLGAGRVFAFEWLLRLLHGLACWLAGRGVALDGVDFPYPRPAHAADYDLIYTASSRFDAPVLEASFAANLLELPVRRDEAALLRFLDGAPGKITTLYRRDREMVQRVRDTLRDALPELPDLEAVAQRLNLSPRTLHRRLEEEGSGFRTIKDALRRDLALSRLTKTSQPLGQIAADLGFADPSAFFRAFVSWTGTSPSQYRKRLRAQKEQPGAPRVTPQA
ncbi:transcriptional regulator [Azospira sp. I13]|uniref:AraC family transcriptional regulator n=1 Tax=Azospira sp. I13 TaxID=1765050 RepID=UPI000D4C2E86|nr:AraC family transcriptional regulator [Azospira sp. I13]GBG03433.1 transcriptional regulator [Azospira sp. I13]